MKMHPDTVSLMRHLIRQHDSDKRREMYRSGMFPRADKVKDLDKRYRWDLFWIVWAEDGELRQLISHGNYNDAHIDTALRAVVPSLKEEDK